MVSTHSQLPFGRDMKGPPMVFSRAVATPQHARPLSRGPPPNVSVVAGGHASSGSGSWVPAPRPVVATPAVATSIGTTAGIAHLCQTLPPQISCPVPWDQHLSFTPPVQAPMNANSDHGASLVPVVSGTSSLVPVTSEYRLSQLPSASSATVGKNDDPDVCSLGAKVVVGSHRFRCTSVLSRGSFGDVWVGEEIGPQGALEVALKDIMCSSQSDLDQALFEAKILETFQAGARCSYSSGAPPPQLRMTCYIAHRVDRRSIRGKTGWRVRMAMTRVPGEPLDSFLKRPPPAGQDEQSAVRRGCLLALQMVKQLAPTLSAISQNAVHRCVNAHNILLSDAADGGPFRCNLDPEEASSRARFWLIDFGLAVDATTWPRAWREADIVGDCCYWPQSSWFVGFWGADEVAKHPNLCNQYVHRLDVFGLGIAALEILCTTALDGSNAAGCQSGASDGLRGSWRRLLNAWTKYWTDVTKWYRQIYGIFQQGRGVGSLQELAKEGIVDKVIERMATIRECLRKCVQRIDDPRIQALLTALADMLDESSSMGLRDVQAILGVHAIPHISTQTIAPPGAQAPLQPSAHSFPNANVSSPSNVEAAQTLSFMQRYEIFEQSFVPPLVRLQPDPCLMMHHNRCDVGTFGLHVGTPGHLWLESNAEAPPKSDVQELISKLGGQPGACFSEFQSLAISRLQEVKLYVDGAFESSLCHGDDKDDFKVSIPAQKLVALLGSEHFHRLLVIFGSMPDEILIRRCQAHGQCINFHLDHSFKTMQVALNSDEEYIGGRLVFATDSGLQAPLRSVGTVTLHHNDIVHGVTKLEKGIRYGLFFLDKTSKSI